MTYAILYGFVGFPGVACIVLTFVWSSCCSLSVLAPLPLPTDNFLASIWSRGGWSPLLHTEMCGTRERGLSAVVSRAHPGCRPRYYLDDGLVEVGLTPPRSRPCTVTLSRFADMFLDHCGPCSPPRTEPTCRFDWVAARSVAEGLMTDYLSPLVDARPHLVVAGHRLLPVIDSYWSLCAGRLTCYSGQGWVCGDGRPPDPRCEGCPSGA